MHTILFETIEEKPKCVEDESAVNEDFAYEFLSGRGLCDYCSDMDNSDIESALYMLSERFQFSFDKYVDVYGEEFFGLNKENISKFIKNFINWSIKKAVKGKKNYDDFINNLENVKKGTETYNSMNEFYVRNAMDDKFDTMFYCDECNYTSLFNFVMYLNSSKIKEIYFIKVISVNY